MRAEVDFSPDLQKCVVKSLVMCSVHVLRFIPLCKLCMAMMATHCIVVTLVSEPYHPLPFLAGWLSLFSA